MKVLLFTIILGYAAAGHHKEAWRRALCQENDELRNDIEACFEQESKEVQDLTRNCVSSVLPSSHGDLKYFTRMACIDVALFDKADECYRVHEIFKNYVATNKDAIVCYEHLFQKYHLQELVNFFKDLEHYNDK